MREPNDFETAFSAMTAEMPDAILMVADALTVLNRKRVFDFAAAHRLPAIFESDFHVRDGGLMSYGADSGRKLLQGRRTDRPYPQRREAGGPALRAADPLCLCDQSAAPRKLSASTYPSTLLARADEVIE